MEIYASTPYEYSHKKFAYNTFKLKICCNKYVWDYCYLGSLLPPPHFSPIGYLLDHNRIVGSSIEFQPADLEGEYFGNPSQ